MAFSQARATEFVVSALGDQLGLDDVRRDGLLPDAETPGAAYLVRTDRGQLECSS